MSEQHHIVLATRNRGKIAELSAMLAEFGVSVHSLAEHPEVGELPETGDTFEANALQKAAEACRQTGMICVADDSGLEVDALGGEPGIYSARYAGPGASDADNVRKLLARMAWVDEAKRTGRFVCVMAAVAPSGATLTARGQWDGVIATQPVGEGGFGYDPVFYDPELACTAAQMSPETKNARSHRGAALAALLDAWPEFWDAATRGDATP